MSVASSKTNKSIFVEIVVFVEILPCLVFGFAQLILKLHKLVMLFLREVQAAVLETVKYLIDESRLLLGEIRPLA